MSETNAADDSGTDTTRIYVKSDTRDKLRARKVGGETFDEVVNRLLETAPEPAWKDGESL